MSSIVDLLTEGISRSGVGQIQRQIGADNDTTSKAIPAAIGALVSALAGNSSRQSGAEALLGALERDHDGSILDNLEGYLEQPDPGTGDGILRHVLGDRRNAVASGLGEAVGLDSASMSQLLTVLAPLVMGALGKANPDGGLDAVSLSSILGREREAARRSMPADLGALSSLLDRNGDGSIGDDAIRLGGSLLKNLFGRR